MKYIYIVIAVVIVIVGLFAYFLFFRGGAKTDLGAGSTGGGVPQALGSLTPLTPDAIPSGDTIRFGTSNGTILVKNFYKVAQGFDGDALVVRASSEYQIIYNKDDGAFGILITNGPVKSSVSAAENDLLATLGVQKDQACSLNVVVNVSASVDASLMGKSYLLSFCTGVAGQ